MGADGADAIGRRKAALAERAQRLIALKRTRRAKESPEITRIPVPGEEEQPCDCCNAVTDFAECRARQRSVLPSLVRPTSIKYTLPCEWDSEETGLLELVGTYPPGGLRVERKKQCPCPLAHIDDPVPDPPIYCPAWPPWVPSWEMPLLKSASDDPTSLVKPGGFRCFKG